MDISDEYCELFGEDPEVDGEPQPIRKASWLDVMLNVGAVTALIGGGLCALAAAVAPTHTCGASRSARLEYAQRDQLIETQMAALRQAEDAAADDSKPIVD